MGTLVKDLKVHYQGGKVHVFHGFDPDNWSYFKDLGLLKDLCHVDMAKMWWKEKVLRTVKHHCSYQMQMMWVEEQSDVQLPHDNDNAKNGDNVLNVKEVMAAKIEE
ncbi:hypothetical protein SESBI_37617 [Sesbania bispinosa]|nr:hypothetical protein SESBI_37617 [Sesbania bispinosa]